MDNLAIIGMGCLFPDYADRYNFWERLVRGEKFLSFDSFMGKPVERSGLPRSGSDGFFRGRLPDADIDELDSMGELFKWIAWVTDDALADSGYVGNRDVLKRTGLVMGSVAMTVRDQIDVTYPFLTATVAQEVNSILGRKDFKHFYDRKNDSLKMDCILADTEPVRYIAEKRGIGGPVFMFNAACATPLYALKMASFYLNTGAADMVLAGSHCCNETVAGICGLFDLFGVLCGIGESMPFDRDTKGLITGSGAGLFALKRMADAVRDGDSILAVIENIGWSNDGGSAGGLMAQSVEGQVQTYRSAYGSGLSPEIDYIECHATGTVAGDKAEVESIARYFGEAGIFPRLGALKASTGHFFTASTNASLAKVLLSLQHDLIPATVGIKNPLCDGIILENTRWERREKPRRAGVNAFGFGGVNAHLVLREHLTDRENPAFSIGGFAGEKPGEGALQMAIVGVGLHIGPFENAERFYEAMISGRSGFTEPDESRWRGLEKDSDYMDALGLPEMPKGSYLNALRFDAMRFRMPMKADPYFLRRDMLMLNTAGEAIDDAGLKKGEDSRTAVLIHSAPDHTDMLFLASVELQDSLRTSMEKTCPDLTEAQREEVLRILKEDEDTRETADSVPGMITNIRGCRISNHWGFTGPSFTIFERENSILRSLEVARYLLDEGVVENVVLGASSLAGEIEHLYAQKELGCMDMILERGLAEGAAALVVKRADQALADGDRIYALVDGVSLSGVSGPVPERVEKICADLTAQGLSGEGLGRIVIPRCYDPDREALLEKVCREKMGAGQDIPTENMEDQLGFGFSLSLPASLIKYGMGYLDAEESPDSAQDAKEPDRKDEGKNDRCLIGSYTREGQFGLALLSAPPARQRARRKMISGRAPLAAGFTKPEELLAKIDEILSLPKGAPLQKIFEDSVKDYLGGEPWPYAAVLLFEGKDALQEELQLLKDALPGLIAAGGTYESSRGSRLNLPGDSRTDAAEIASHGISDRRAPESDLKPEMQTSESDLKSKTQMSESDLKSETQASESDSKPATWGSGSDLKSETQGPESDSDGEELNRLCRRMRRDSALRLAAKIITDRNPLDYAAFLDRFDFAFLRRPSWWIRVSTGMHDLPGRLGSPENRARIARLGQATAVDQAPLPGQAPPVSQAVQPGQTTPVGQAAPPGQATAVGQTPQLGQATPASQTPPSVQPPAPPENRSGSLAPGMHSALHPGIHPALPSAYGTVVARSLIHNLGAYRLYAENEMMLISSLSAAAVSAGPAGHTARSAAPFTGISTAAIGPATVPAVPAIVPPTPGSAGPIPLSACRETPVLYSREQILEITGGSISRVLGERYAKADRYEKRARLPLPPFMFVDRVLALDATFGVLRPSRIETAYDIPRDSVLSMSDSAVSYVLMTESSQVAILLLSIAGIDLMGDEVLSYRILDSTTRFHGESPMKGDTLHSVLAFTDFQKSGETTLVSSRYACYNQGRLVLTQELTGGLFRESDLRVVKGMNMPRRSLDLSSLAAPGGGVSPRAVDLQGFYEGSCGPDMVVGRGHEKVERLHVDPGGRMVDRLTQVSFSGGAYGLGMIAAEKDLDADHWAFAVHFKNDPVFPGSLMAEAANQLQVIFAISAGYIRDKKVRLGFVNDAPVKISFRGQVMPEPSVLRYNWHVKSLRSRQGRTVLVSDCDVHWKDAHVVRIEDLTMVIEEVE